MITLHVQCYFLSIAIAGLGHLCPLGLFLYTCRICSNLNVCNLVCILVLSRIKLSFTNTVIRLENIPPDCTSGVGLELHIDR